MSFKDHFSAQADAYARYRPTYPSELFAHLASLAPGRRIAWDCATGNGQAAKGLVPFFDEIIATDASAEQLRHAEPHPKIRYAQARSEASGIPEESVDLVTVATAVHWFDFDAFYAEVKRVLRPDGVLAVWCFNSGSTGEPVVDAIISEFLDKKVGPYFPEEVHRWVLTDYRTLPFPFPEIPCPRFTLTREWGSEDILGYFSSWSGSRRYLEQTGENPIAWVRPRLCSAVGARRVRMTWPLHLRVGRHLAGSSGEGET